MTAPDISSVWRSTETALSVAFRRIWHSLVAFALWIRESADQDKDRSFLWRPVFIGAGIAAYFSLDHEPPYFLGVAVLIICGLVWLPVRRARQNWIRFAIIAVSLAALGFQLAQWRAWSVASPVLEDDNRPRTVNGQVVRVSLLTPRGYKILLRPDSIERQGATALPALLKLTIRSDAVSISPGDWVSFPAIVRGPPEPVAPGAFDFRRMYWFDRVGGVGFSVGDVHLTGALRSNTWIESWQIGTARFRAHISQRVQAALPDEEGAVASALLTGERAAISKDDLQALRDSGLAHLLAISGLHMGLAGFGIFFAVRFLLSLSEYVTLHYPIKKWAAGAALFGILFYLVASGLAVSAQRAAIMAGVIFIAVILDRAAITLRTVAIAATLMICLTPEVVVEAGFQMSFAAVICLVTAYEFIRTKNFMQPQNGGHSAVRWVAIYVLGIVITSLIASFATSPMSAYHFHRVPHYSVLGDLVAMPLMAGVVMPSAILTFLLMPLGLEALPLQVMGWGIRQILAVGQFVADIPGAVSGVAAWSPLAFGCIILGGLWLCIWRESWRILGLPVMGAGLMIGLMTDQPDVLISADARQILYRIPSGEVVAIDPRRKRFEAEAWLRRDGNLHPLKAAAALAPDRRTCDAKGCVAELYTGHILAISRSPGSLGDDCQRADILISTRPIRKPCRGPELVIDRFDLWRQGTHAIWLKPGSMRYRTNRMSDGRRLWTGAGL